MNIRQVTDGKEDYIELLRMGDPDDPESVKYWKKVNSFYLKTWKTPYIVRGYIFGRKEM